MSNGRHALHMSSEALGALVGGHGRHAIGALSQRKPGRRQARRVVTSSKKKNKPEYGSGRARLPGLADMPGLEGQLGSAPSTGGSSGSSGGSSSGPSGVSGRAPSSSSGGGESGGGEPQPTLAEYLEFGRLLGERPRQVQQQLELGGVQVRIDQESQQYLQSWEREELEAYAMFEAVVAAEATRSPGTSGAAKKLQRNKNTLSVAASAAELSRGARAEYERGVPMTASQRRLARNKRSSVGLGMRASFEALMGDAGIGRDADDAFELVSRPARPSRTAPTLAAKPSRPEDLQSADEEEDEAYYDELEGLEAEFEAAWAEAEAEAEAGVTGAAPAAPGGATYEAFNDLLTKPGQAAAKPAGSSGSGSKKTDKKSGGGPEFTARGTGSLATVQQLKGALQGRPARPTQLAPQTPAPATPEAGMVRLQLRGRPAAPPSLAAKPQASSAARAAAQRPAPPPEPKLASKPSRPAASAPPPKAPAAPPKPQAVPELAAKPAAHAPHSATQAAAAAPPAPAAPQPAAATAAAAESTQPPAAAKRQTTAGSQAEPAAASAVEPAEVEQPPTPAAPESSAAANIAQPAEAEAAAAQVPSADGSKPEAAAAAAVSTAEDAPAVPAPRQRKAAAAKLQRPAAPKQPAAAQQAASTASFAERRAANAEYGKVCLIDRSVQTLTVWQTNPAGVLVRNEQLSGFIPFSLLSPLHMAAVLEAEQPLLAAAAAGAIVAQLEAQHAPATAADGADLGSEQRSAARAQALAAVMIGRQVAARVVNVDDQSGRVVLSERAAVSAWRERGMRASPPSLPELRTAAAMLGEVVDATVVHIKPFGCFVEFAVEVPATHPGSPARGKGSSSSGGGGAAPTGAPGAAGPGARPAMQRVPLVGLVHRSEVSWDPTVDILQALKVGQSVRAKLMHVDTGKARVFLSMRRTQANPLLETLDSLVTSSAAAAASSSTAAMLGGPAAAGAAAGGSGGAQGGVPQQLDQRPVLGDLAEAARFCELLRGAPGVLAAQLGVRLQSRAASQELEVYMAKDASAGIGAAVAAAGGGTAADLAAPLEDAGGRRFNLVVRKEQSVQEVSVMATLTREEVRQLVATTIASLAAAAAEAAAPA